MATEVAREESTPLAFSPEAEERFQKTLAKYPNLRAALIPALYIAQDDFGYLSIDAMEYVADRLELPPSKVLQVATFYTMYNKRPAGKHMVQVCTSVPCCMMGGYGVLRWFEREFGVGPGETTDDKLFTLVEAECLASCGTAPVIQIDEYYHENVTEEQLAELFQELKSASTGASNGPTEEA